MASSFVRHGEQPVGSVSYLCQLKSKRTFVNIFENKTNFVCGCEIIDKSIFGKWGVFLCGKIDKL